MVASIFYAIKRHSKKSSKITAMQATGSFGIASPKMPPPPPQNSTGLYKKEVANNHSTTSRSHDDSSKTTDSSGDFLTGILTGYAVNSLLNIHSEDTPTWKPAMSFDDNRSATDSIDASSSSSSDSSWTSSSSDSSWSSSSSDSSWSSSSSDSSWSSD